MQRDGIRRQTILEKIMCGICGQISPTDVQNSEIKRMMDSIAHRGPDGEGAIVCGRAALGNRRLSIIDLPGGRQPISNEDGSVWVVYNGEIYNYRELAAELQSKGHVFRTRSDTEVIVHLYEELGEGCVDQLNGMFAFAIWDEKLQKLVLGRDRLGQKPVFYTSEDGHFLFASEIKALLAVRNRPPEMDFEAIHDYLSLRFIPPPRTMLRDIYKLPPAHILVYQDGTIRTSRYWQLSFRSKLELTDQEYLDGLRDRMVNSIASHLISDVPVGAFLSGGLDSSMIVAMMAKDLGVSFKTFAIGVAETDFDETPFARMVANQYRTEHVEEHVRADMIHTLPEMIWHLDEPSDPIAACFYHAAGLAARNVKVVLGGDGGDELFAGFDRYVGMQRMQTYTHLPGFLRRGIVSPVLKRLPDSFGYKSMTQKLRWVNQLSQIDNPGMRYAEATSFFRFSHLDKQALYGHDLWAQMKSRESSRVIAAHFDAIDSGDVLDRMLYADYMTRLPEHSLMLTDRLTMAHGLEARSPFLDHELVEYMAAFPSRLKIQGSTTKVILRRLAQDYLPEKIVQREKQGFMFPVAYWLRGELHDHVRQVLLESSFVREGLFQEESINRMLEEHRNSQVDHHVRLWMLLNLEIWRQTYLLRDWRETIL